MRLTEGLLDYTKEWQWPDIYLFTGNKYITRDGRLVMGRGAAKMIRDEYPGIDTQLAGVLVDNNFPSVTFVNIGMGHRQLLGYFCVKDYYRDLADVKLIEASTNILHSLATGWPEFFFHMNYPGIGAGNLAIEEVQDIVAVLPDNVTLYR